MTSNSSSRRSDMDHTV